MQNEITHRIHTKIIYQIIGINHITFGFTHLSFADKQPRMSKYLLRQRNIQCHQHDRPIDRMETNDIFTDQMQVCRPVFLHHRITVAVQIKTKSGKIVAECIDPYINHMFRIKGDRDSPCKRGSGYTQILKSRQQEIIHSYGIPAE